MERMELFLALIVFLLAAQVYEGGTVIRLNSS